MLLAALFLRLLATNGPLFYCWPLTGLRQYYVDEVLGRAQTIFEAYLSEGDVAVQSLGLATRCCQRIVLNQPPLAVLPIRGSIGQKSTVGKYSIVECRQWFVTVRRQTNRDIESLQTVRGVLPSCRDRQAGKRHRRSSPARVRRPSR